MDPTSKPNCMFDVGSNDGGNMTAAGQRTISPRFALLGYTGRQTNDKVAQQLCSLEPPLTGEGKQPCIRN